MKLFLVAVLTVLYSVSTVYAATISVDIDGMRKSLKCADDVFSEMAQEHQELENHLAEYRGLVAESNSELDECVKIEDSHVKEECYDNVVMTKMVKIIELLANVEYMNEELGRKLQDTIGKRCQDF